MLLPYDVEPIHVEEIGGHEHQVGNQELFYCELSCQSPFELNDLLDSELFKELPITGVSKGLEELLALRTSVSMEPCHINKLHSDFLLDISKLNECLPLIIANPERGRTDAWHCQILNYSLVNLLQVLSLNDSRLEISIKTRQPIPYEASYAMLKFS